MEIYLNNKLFLCDMDEITYDHPWFGTLDEWETPRDPLGIGNRKFIYTWNSIDKLTSPDEVKQWGITIHKVPIPKILPELYRYIGEGEFKQIRMSGNEFSIRGIPNPDHTIRITTKNNPPSREMMRDITKVLDKNKIGWMVTPDYGPVLDHFYYASREITEHLNS